MAAGPAVHGRRAYDRSVPAWLLLLAGALIGLLLAVPMGLWWSRSRSEPTPEPTPTQERGLGVDPTAAVPPGAAAVLGVLRASAVLVGPDDRVVQASASAHQLGLVRDDRLVERELLQLVTYVRRDGLIRESELVLQQGRLSVPRHLAARVAPLGQRLVLVLVEDRTRERRVEAVRRDFVANVSHELKTPVGALSLLAEAVGEAAEDPEAVHRFAARMRVESQRLGRLVQQVIELSRLQDDELMDEPERVDVDDLVAAALDRSRTDAEARDITLAGQTDTGLGVRGNAGQLQVALGNLVENAVAYSDDGSRVAVSVKPADGAVSITVSDQGIGIPESELDRIFERFYRVDPARATATGGTGLGLAIVKHVAASHGGEVRVWSQERIGSSFTLALPCWERQAAGPPEVHSPVPRAEEATP